MAAIAKIALLACLLFPVALMEESKPVLRRGQQRIKNLEKSIKEVKEEMRKQGIKIKEQEQRIKELEECKACSKIEELNQLISELKKEEVPTGDECRNYQSLSSADRKASHVFESNAQCDKELGPGWFRFEGAAGTRMPTSCTPTNRCGTHATGWLNGEHPAVADGKVTRQVCFHYSSNCCVASTDIQVRNCGSFYVYYFNSVPFCYQRYCSTD